MALRAGGSATVGSLKVTPLVYSAASADASVALRLALPEAARAMKSPTLDVARALAAAPLLPRLASLALRSAAGPFMEASAASPSPLLSLAVGSGGI